MCTNAVVVSSNKIPKWIYGDGKDIMFGAAGQRIKDVLVLVDFWRERLADVHRII